MTQKVDYAFGENGLVAYKLGNELDSNSFIQYVGEEEYKKMVNWILRYLADVDIPIKRYVAGCTRHKAHTLTIVEPSSSSEEE